MHFAALQSRQDVPIPPFNPIMSESALAALIWLELIVCLIFVALRTWVQYFHSNNRLYSNDYLIFLALICHICAIAVCQSAIPYMYEIEKFKLVVFAGGTPTLGMIQSATTFLPHQFALLFLLWTTLWSVKFSLLIFFWRLFDSVQTRARIFWYIMIVITASTFTITVFIQLFACGSPQNFFQLGLFPILPLPHRPLTIYFQTAAPPRTASTSPTSSSSSPPAPTLPATSSSS